MVVGCRMLSVMGGTNLAMYDVGGVGLVVVIEEGLLCGRGCCAGDGEEVVDVVAIGKHMFLLFCV